MTAESNNRAGHYPGKVIPYKEYAACKAAEVKPSTTSKPTVEDEEDWDEEPLLPPCETLPGAKPVLQSQEDEWKLMINQDPHSGSVTWDSGHGTMAVTPEDDPADSDEKLDGAVGGTDENVSAENLSDVEWKKDNPLFEFNDENVTIPQTPDAASTPVQTLTENKTGSSLESSLEKKPCFQESITVHLLKATPPLHLKPDYSNTELVGYTWPPLVNVIPWIKYEAQNMRSQSLGRSSSA